jgi:hypothetical protein
VKPARAQVYYEPIENLDIKGLFIWIGAIIILEILETEYCGWWSEFRFRRQKKITEFAQTEIVK